MDKKEDLLVIYRKNILLDFIKDKALIIHIQTSSIENSESNGLNDSF